MRRGPTSLLGNGGPESPGRLRVPTSNILPRKLGWCAQGAMISGEARSRAWVGTPAPQCPGPGRNKGSGNLESKCSLEPWVWHSDTWACGGQLRDSGWFAGPQGGLTRGSRGAAAAEVTTTRSAGRGKYWHTHLELCGRGLPSWGRPLPLPRVWPALQELRPLLKWQRSCWGMTRGVGRGSRAGASSGRSGRGRAAAVLHAVARYRQPVHVCSLAERLAGHHVLLLLPHQPVLHQPRGGHSHVVLQPAAVPLLEVTVVSQQHQGLQLREGACL